MPHPDQPTPATIADLAPALAKWKGVLPDYQQRTPAQVAEQIARYIDESGHCDRSDIVTDALSS